MDEEKETPMVAMKDSTLVGEMVDHSESNLVDDSVDQLGCELTGQLEQRKVVWKVGSREN
jgi:hypothetical protein